MACQVALGKTFLDRYKDALMTSSAMNSSMERTNQQWVDELRGSNGALTQEAALIALANMLYIKVYNYLRLRRSSVYGLAAFTDEEIAEIAKDFVQDGLARLTDNECALLDTFQNRGKFENWCATIVYHIAGGELRRPFWLRRLELPEEIEDSEQDRPEFQAQAALIRSILDDCISRLPERQRTAFEQSIILELSAKAIQETLAVKESAIHQLVYRARANLRTCIEKQGVGLHSLDAFS